MFDKAREYPAEGEREMRKIPEKLLPIVYSCSGCSSAAQMANHLALCLDRQGVAEMSCIAGVGAGVKPLVHMAQSGRPIVAIDGCPLACARACLAQQQLVPNLHYDLSEMGVKKMKHQDFDLLQAAGLLQQMSSAIRQLQQPELA